jgi:cation diffusion facilitator family transporter
MPSETSRTVVVALAAGLGVAIAKLFAAIVTGSPAMTAEASHSFADFANDLFLLVAQLRSHRAPDDEHPFGYGREAYFWALLAALGAFLAGAAFSLREGINSLIHPVATSSFLLAYVVLAVSTVFDLVSFRQSVRQMVEGARRNRRGVLAHAALTSDPMLRGVFNEDSVSIAGDLAAFAGLAISQGTGSSVPQGIAAVVVGLLLVRISLRMVRRNHDFLLGQPVPLAQQQQVRDFLLARPEVTAVHQLLVTFLGPDQVWILARISVRPSLRADEVAALVSDLDAGIHQASQSVSRIDIITAREGT